MESKVSIMMPSTFDKYSIVDVLTQVIDTDMQPKTKRVEFDLRTINFIKPGGMTAFFNLCQWLSRKEDVKTTFKLPSNDSKNNQNNKVMRYFEDCGFFRFFTGNETIYKKPELRKTTLPMILLRVEDSYQWKDNTLKEWLKRCTKSESEFVNVQVAVEEIFNNIKDHSEECIGCVFAQFYPNLGKIILSVSDFGVGIPNSMRKLLGNENDDVLLAEAVTEGVSTQSTPRNRGAGLCNIVRSLTNSGIGSVYIRSNCGIVIYEDKVLVEQTLSEGYYPGTFFEIEIDINNEMLYDEEKEEEFVW